MSISLASLTYFDCLNVIIEEGGLEITSVKDFLGNGHPRAVAAASPNMEII